jgi:hypothetical protein
MELIEIISTADFYLETVASGDFNPRHADFQARSSEYRIAIFPAKYGYFAKLSQELIQRSKCNLKLIVVQKTITRFRESDAQLCF